MTTKELQQTFLGKFALDGFERIAPMSMLSRAFPTNFTPSGGEEPLADMLSGTLPHKNVCTIQPCFRYQDIFPQGSRVHLPYFHMAVAISLDDYSVNDMVGQHIAFFEALGLDRSKFRVSIFNGGEQKGAALDHDAVAHSAWLAHGIGESQFTYLGVDENFFLSPMEGYAGTKTEVFYPWNDQWLELSVIVRLTHRLEGDLLDKPFPRSVVCGGIGVERLVLLLSGYDHIVDCTDQVACVAADIPLDEKECLVLLKALEMLYRDGASLKDTSEARSRTLKRLIKQLIIRMEEADSQVPDRLSELLGANDLAPAARTTLIADVVHVAKRHHLQTA